MRWSTNRLTVFRWEKCAAMGGFTSLSKTSASIAISSGSKVSYLLSQNNRSVDKWKISLKSLKEVEINQKQDTLTFITFTDKSLSCSGFSDFQRARDMLMSLHLGNSTANIDPK